MSPSPNAATAAEQLRRLLLVLPTLADDQVHSLDDIASRIASVSRRASCLSSVRTRDNTVDSSTIAVTRRTTAAVSDTCCSASAHIRARTEGSAEACCA